MLRKLSSNVTMQALDWNPKRHGVSGAEEDFLNRVLWGSVVAALCSPRNHNCDITSLCQDEIDTLEMNYLVVIFLVRS